MPETPSKLAFTKGSRMTNDQPLNKVHHGHLHLSPQPDYRFAARDNFCAVFLQELPQLVAEYLICFPNNQSDLPHVLLGFFKESNAYLDPQGQWRGHYIPASLRRYPFTLAKIEGSDDDAYTLAIDPDAPQLSAEHGEPLFHGEQLSPLVQQRIELLKGIEAQRRLTQQAVQHIDQLGLFKIEQLSIKHGCETLVNIAGLRMIDPERLKQLDAPALKTLHDSGALELIHAHRFSLANLQRGPLQAQLQASIPASQANTLFGADEGTLVFHGSSTKPVELDLKPRSV